MPDAVRREFHSDAPRLDAFVGDCSAYLSADVYRRLRVHHAGWCAPAPTPAWASAEHVWSLILERGLRAPAFRVVRDGSTLGRADYCRGAGVGNRDLDDVVEPNKVLELHQNGATVVLQGIQHVDPAFARLSTNLALDLDQPVQVNAYLSPADARGLDVHFDYHDVLVAQLAGTKRWRVWEPIERTRRPVKNGPGIPMPTLDELAEPLIDRIVQPGDCLAIPRGFPHAAETVDDESSHLTIGIMALTWERVIRRLLATGVSNTALADRLPAGSLDGPDPERTASAYDPSAAVAALAARLDPVALRSAVATEVWRRQPRTRLRPRRSPTIDAEQPLHFTPGPLVWLDGGPEATRLHLGDRRLRLPPDSARLVRSVLAHAGCFTADDVRDGLDLDATMIVLQRLTDEGLLAVA